LGELVRAMLYGPNPMICEGSINIALVVVVVWGAGGGRGRVGGLI